jgi:hypothetical protein
LNQTAPIIITTSLLLVLAELEEKSRREAVSIRKLDFPGFFRFVSGKIKNKLHYREREYYA